MKENLQSNIYDKLFDFRKINHIRSSDGGFYDNVACQIGSNVNSVQNIRILNNSTISSQCLQSSQTENLYFIDTSSNSSTYSSYQKFSLSEYGPVKFSTVRSKISKKSKINRSKSLVLKKNRNFNIFKQNYVDSYQANNYPEQTYNRLSKYFYN